MAKSTNYQIVTDRILEALDRGTIPWRITWKRAGGRPENFLTGRPYHGMNVVMLALTSATAGYSSAKYMTFNQAKQIGGKVRKGEKGTPIVFWKIMEDEKTREKFPILKRFTVFNIDQIDGIDYTPQEIEERENDPIEEAEEIVQGYLGKPEIINRGDQPLYSPVEDAVILPPRSHFENSAAYYHTLFHELTHSTGHQSRLNRLKAGAGFGTKEYSREELVAELGAAFLCNIAGIDIPELVENSAAYIDGWRKRLSEDPSLIITAAGRAQKAVEYMKRSEAAEKAA